MKQCIFDLSIIKLTQAEKTFKELFKYLVENKDIILPEHGHIVSLLKDIKLAEKTALDEILNHFIQTTYSNFSFIIVPIDKSIPSILHSPYYPIDFNTLKRFKAYRAYLNTINSISGYNNKILINCTEYLNSGHTKVVDGFGISRYMIRGAYNRSYANYKDIWLTISELEPITKFYSSILSSAIAKMYNLDLKTQNIISIIFAYFFLQKCIETDKLDNIQQLLCQFKFLGLSPKIKGILVQCEDILESKEILSIHDIIKLLQELIGGRLSKINIKTIMAVARGFNINPIIGMLASEYPAYWVYSLACCVSGDRTGLYFTAKNINLLKEMVLFIDKLNSSRQFMLSLQKKI